MDTERFLAGPTQSSSSPVSDLLIETLYDLPSAACDLAVEAWEHPWQTAEHVVKTVGSAAVVGTALGALVPSRGPAELLAGAVFSIPIALGEYNRFRTAIDKAGEPGADIHTIAQELARGTVSDTANIGMSFLGGSLGGKLGHSLATSETAIGASLQQIQRKVLKAENGGMLALNSVPEFFSSRSVAESIAAEAAVKAPPSSVALGKLVEPNPTAVRTENGAVGAPFLRAKKAWFAGENSALNNRLAQVQAGESGGAAPKLQEFYGQVHGHSRYSDGIGLPKDIFQSAKEGGQSFYAITDHNHLAARDGVKPNDPRARDEAGTAIIAASPIEYSQTFADALLQTEANKFVGLVGTEMGTIGKVGGGGHNHGGLGGRKRFSEPETGDFHHVHEAREVPQFLRVFEPDGKINIHPIDPLEASPAKSVALTEKPDATLLDKKLAWGRAADAPVEQPNGQSYPTPDDTLLDNPTRERSHYGGVNHINLFEVPQFFEAVRQPKPRPQRIFDSVTGPLRSLFGAAEPTEVRPPEVIKYNDGDYKAMVDHLDQLTDTTGKRPVIQLNHPRFTADWDPRLDPATRGRDYGIKSFKNIAEWRERFGKYASQIEVITGEALNPNPTTTVRTSDLGPINMAGYIDKGLHLSPTFGRDDHYAMPNARPAGTGIFAESLTKEGLLDAMRERRTIATTSTDLLRGQMTVNEKYPMGTIFDQTAVNDLNIKMTVGGNLDPAAKYKVTLYGDPKVGDGQLAKAMQMKEVTGADLRDTHGQVLFDQVHHTIGNSSAWYVEVQRTDPRTGNVDYLWTAPVWVEPLSGQHSLLTRGLVGVGSQFLLGVN